MIYSLSNCEAYDLEIYWNLFLAGFHNMVTNRRVWFEISPRKDERKELNNFLCLKPTMIGYNNFEYDHRMLYEFVKLTADPDIKASKVVKRLKKLSNELINSKGGRKWIKILIPQIDLMKINHYDPKSAKHCSLKALQFSLRTPIIQELPYHHEKVLTNDEIDGVIKYWHNDMDTTVHFAKKNREPIERRMTLIKKLNHDVMNYNDVKIGEFIILQRLRNELGTYDLGKTVRTEFVFNDIIFKHIKFRSEELNRFVAWMRSQVVTATKGVFTNMHLERIIGIEDLMILESRNIVTKKINDIKTPLMKSLIVCYKGVEITVGVGGLHQALETTIVESDNQFIIKSCDVSSQYPNCSIQNELFPLHLGKTFCVVYKDIYIERGTYSKGTPMNQSLKDALNGGGYGKTNSEFSPLYDPQFMLSITLNCQMMVLGLAEELIDCIPECKVVMTNTDGLEVLIPRIHEILYHDICKRWEESTKFKLEYLDYQKMIIRDVNNYIAISTEGKIKRKGAYEYDRPLHKDLSMLVVPKAVEQYYLNNTPIETYIKKHTDIYDFFLRTNIEKKEYKLVIRYNNEENTNEVELQRITRYLVTNTGGTLIKLMPPLKDKIDIRETNLQKGYLTTICNDMTIIEEAELWKDINYDFYINEANKLLITNG